MRLLLNKILVIGDAHTSEHDTDKDLERFSLLSSLIVDQEPDHIVIIGDFLTLNCLSFWDKDKRQKMEGRRYNKEIENGNIALGLMQNGYLLENDKRRENKKKLYCPTIAYLEGNHEERLRRYLAKDPTFEGIVSVPKNLKLDKRGINWVPYREWHYINDIGFTHIPHGKVKEISGVDICRKAANVTIKSCVFGHTHELHTSCFHVEGMSHLQQVLNCGCFIGKKEEYVHGRVTNYWRGVLMLHNWKPGRFDIDTYSLGLLERMYG